MYSPHQEQGHCCCGIAMNRQSNNHALQRCTARAVSSDTSTSDELCSTRLQALQ
uniref:Uncharacterized protein n=1 Tax=Arundo donax TaxID=35708 RepID=A0A0A9A2E8_ARUDO